MSTARKSPSKAPQLRIDGRSPAALLETTTLQSAMFNRTTVSSICTDPNGVIRIFDVGAERMLGYSAADVIDTFTPADVSDPQELFARASALSLEFVIPIAPGFEALAF
jgi:hypothetical protein